MPKDRSVNTDTDAVRVLPVTRRRAKLSMIEAFCIAVHQPLGVKENDGAEITRQPHGMSTLKNDNWWKSMEIYPHQSNV